MAEQPLKQRTARGLIWGLLDSGSMQVLNLVIGIFLARALSQADYGLAGEILIFSTLASNLQDSGFTQALINRRNPTALDINSIFWFNVGMSLLMFVLLWLCAPLIALFFGEPSLVWLSRYAFVGCFLASLCIVPRALLRRQLRMRELTLTTLVSLPMSGVVAIALALLGCGPWSLVTQSVVLVGCGALMAWHFSGFRPRRLFSWKPIREMFSFSCKLLVTNIFNTLNNSVFTFAFGRFYTKLEVGTYTQADKWNKMGAQLISGMVQGVAQPMFVQVGDDGKRLQRAFRKMLRFTSLLAFPCMFGLALTAEPLIQITIGAKWLSSAHLMQMLCVAGAFMPVTVLYHNLLISRGRSDVYMWNILAQGLLVLAVLCAIKWWGLSVTLGGHVLSGVRLMVMSYVAVYVLWLFLWHVFLQRALRLPLLLALRDTLPFAIAAAVAMGVAWVASREVSNVWLVLAVRIAVAAVVYVAIIWIAGAKILREAVGYLLRRPTESSHSPANESAPLSKSNS